VTVTAEMLHQLAETTRSAKQLACGEEPCYCPICGCRLHKYGKRLFCDRHGEMRVYLPTPEGVGLRWWY